jgi:hypothetical protein
LADRGAPTRKADIKSQALSLLARQRLKDGVPPPDPDERKGDLRFTTAFYRLRRAGLIRTQSGDHGIYAITGDGRQALSERPDGLDCAFLTSFPTYSRLDAIDKERKNLEKALDAQDEAETAGLILALPPEGFRRLADTLARSAGDRLGVAVPFETLTPADGPETIERLGGLSQGKEKGKTGWILFASGGLAPEAESIIRDLPTGVTVMRAPDMARAMREKGICVKEDTFAKTVDMDFLDMIMA